MAGLVPVVAAALLSAEAAVIPVAPERSLASVLREVQPGDVVALAPGVHSGPVTITTSLALEGQPGAVIDGGGRGRVITVAAPGVVVRGLTITGSGISLADEDSGIYVTEDGDGALIERNRIENNLIGVYLKGPEDAVVRGNQILGRRDLRMNERGNGVQLWNTPASRVENNDIRYGRDGIFVTTSRGNVFSGNRFRDLRYGVHYMYTNDSEVAGNISLGNHAGYALMYSRQIRVAGNLSRGDRDHGILLNFVNSSAIINNAVVAGGNKCVFIYNANKNLFRGNWFENCAIGVHFTAGSERNEIVGNAFIANRTQVKYVGTRDIIWSAEGIGNYWSDNPAFDLDGDGTSDRPYRPNDLVDQIVWAAPAAKLLLNSPAVEVLRLAQSRFPLLHPGGVVDLAPLIRPPRSDALRLTEQTSWRQR